MFVRYHLARRRRFSSPNIYNDAITVVCADVHWYMYNIIKLLKLITQNTFNSYLYASFPSFIGLIVVSHPTSHCHVFIFVFLKTKKGIYFRSAELRFIQHYSVTVSTVHSIYVYVLYEYFNRL